MARLVSEAEMGFSLNPLHDISSALHAGERLADKALHSGGKLADEGAKGFEGALKDAAKVAKNISPSQIGHTALDAVGMIPVVGTAANLANAGWYAAEGDWTDAGMSALAAIPIEGDAVDALKLGKDGVEIAEDVTRAGEDGADIAGEAAKVGTRDEPSAAEPHPDAGAPPKKPPDDETPPTTGSAEPPESPEGGEGSSLPKSVEEIIENPNVLAGKTPAEIEGAISKTPGWKVERLGKGSHEGTGWVFREYTERGDPTGRMIRWHPGGGHHGPAPYWRVTGGPYGKSGIIR